MIVVAVLQWKAETLRINTSKQTCSPQNIQGLTVHWTRVRLTNGLFSGHRANCAVTQNRLYDTFQHYTYFTFFVFIPPLRLTHYHLCILFCPFRPLSFLPSLVLHFFYFLPRPPLWSSGQSFWLQIQRSWVRFRALPDFLRTIGSGTGSTASWGQLKSYLEEIVAAPVKKTETTTGGIHCADHATPSIRKSWHYFANKRRSLGRHSSLADQSHFIFLSLSVFASILLLLFYYSFLFSIFVCG
jgi:hypothetical protein